MLKCNFGTFSYEEGFTDIIEISLTLSPDFVSQEDVNTTWLISSDEEDQYPLNNQKTISRKATRYSDVFLQFLGFLSSRSDANPVAGTLWEVPPFTFGNDGPSTGDLFFSNNCFFFLSFF